MPYFLNFDSDLWVPVLLIGSARSVFMVAYIYNVILKTPSYDKNTGWLVLKLFEAVINFIVATSKMSVSFCLARYGAVFHRTATPSADLQTAQQHKQKMLSNNKHKQCWDVCGDL